MIRLTFAQAPILLTLPLILTACLGTEGGQPKTIEETSQRIMQTFKEASGHELQRRSLSEKIRKFLHAPRIETLSFTRVSETASGVDLTKDPALTERYGNFVIYVFEDRKTRDDRIDGGRADHDGNHWRNDVPERGPDAGKPYWVADKAYGDTVLLSWVSDTRRPETSVQWERLDTLLQKAVG
jgi:hypothetical protein